MVLWQTSPFWITIVAWFMLKEPIIPLELVCMVICFSAVALIAWQSGNNDDELSTEKDYSDTSLAGLIVALCSAVTMAFVAVLSRALK